MADSADELRQRAEDILAQDRYHPQPGLLARLWGWIADRLPEFSEPTPEPGQDVSSLHVADYLQVGLIVILIALIVWALVRSGVRLRFRRPRRAETDEPEITVTQRVRPTTRDEWLARARQAESDRRYGEAVRAWGQATLTGLADRNRIPATVGHTVNELRRAYQGDRAEEDGLTETTGRYSDVWYGGAPADEDDSRRLAAIDELLVDDDRDGRVRRRHR
ncbi:MAG: DUF4129 domain-containing protein [Acidimicrobiales bacterium]